MALSPHPTDPNRDKVKSRIKQLMKEGDSEALLTEFNIDLDKKPKEKRNFR